MQKYSLGLFLKKELIKVNRLNKNKNKKEIIYNYKIKRKTTLPLLYS